MCRSPDLFASRSTAPSSVVAEGRPSSAPVDAASLPPSLPAILEEVDRTDAVMSEDVDPSLLDPRPSRVLQTADIQQSAGRVSPVDPQAMIASRRQVAPYLPFLEPVLSPAEARVGDSDSSDCYIVDPRSSTIGSVGQAALVRPRSIPPACPPRLSHQRPASASIPHEQPAGMSTENDLDLVLGVAATQGAPAGSVLAPSSPPASLTATGAIKTGNRKRGTIWSSLLAQRPQWQFLTREWQSLTREWQSLTREWLLPTIYFLRQIRHCRPLRLLSHPSTTQTTMALSRVLDRGPSAAVKTQCR